MTALLPTVPKVSAAYENTYVNTGNQAEDLIGVAMTQVGYTEGPNNDTKYGDWMNLSNQAWCAIFISWCADQADIPTTVINPSAWAHPRKGNGFNIPYYHGADYTPKRGDLFFKEDFSHVGIVYGVEGDYALTIEANTNDDGSAEGYAVLLRKRKIDECYFGVPAYRTCGDGHNYTIKYEPGHPHKRYYYCSTCKKAFYTGSIQLVTTCSLCMGCSCSTGISGYYKVVVPEGRAMVYNSHKANSVSGALDSGEVVYLVAGSSYMAHVIYGCSPAYVLMKYLQKFVYPPVDLSADKSVYYENDPVQLSWNHSSTATSYQITVLKDGETVLAEDVGYVTGHTLNLPEGGNYQVQLQANDGTAFSDPITCTFQVMQTYTLTLDATNGSGGAAQQIKQSDRDLVLTNDIPSRAGFVLLGWTENRRANYATWKPGDVWTDNRDATLYAVWQKEDAVATQLQIFSELPQRLYLVGQTPRTEGLVLAQIFSDGTQKLISEGYRVDGAVAKETGIHTVTITYKDLSVTYEILVLAYPVADLETQWNFQMDNLTPLLWPEP